MKKNTTIQVQGTSISILSEKGADYISLTDMLKAKDGESFRSGACIFVITIKVCNNY